MRKTTIALLVSGLFAAPSAMAQMTVTGSVNASAMGTDLSKERNAYRFDEYKDMSNGGTFGLDLKGEGKDYFLRFFGENFGRDDQFLELKGGKYGSFKYSLYGNDIIHNLTHNAITPFSGVGTNNLTFPGGNTGVLQLPTNTATWNNFDYKIKHENWGGTFEMQSAPNSPWYFRVTGNEKTTKGVKPMGSAGQSPGGPAYELAAPVNYTTTDFSYEAGYATKLAQYSVNLSYSRFQDHNDYLFWRNPSLVSPASTTTTEQNTLAADNKMWKLAANAVWKQLPFAASTLALRGTYSKLTNDLPVPQTGLATATVAGLTAGQVVFMQPSNTLFSGEVNKITFSAALNSQWTRELDSKIYYNYERKENKSTDIVFRPINATTGAVTQTCDLNPQTGVAVPPGNTCSNEPFHYKKNNIGFDLHYRFDPQNRIAGGWDYAQTKRERIDFEETTDNKLYVEWRNSSLDTLTGRIKYQRLHRRSDFELGSINPAANANNLFNFYLRRYDLNDNDQDLLKLVLDYSPMQFLDFGGEVIYKKNDYQNATLGRRKDTREELYLTGSYGDATKFRVTAFFDYERTQYDSSHWVGTPVPATFPAAVSATQYLWTGKVKDKNYVIGLAGDWPFSQQLKFKGSLTWQDTDGTVDMQSNTALAPLQNITSPPGYDSFKRTTLHLQGTYAVNKEFDVQFGYAYDRFRYNDIQVDGYLYTLGAAPNTSFFSGAYAFQNYTANTIYAMLRYNLR